MAEKSRFFVAIAMLLALFGLGIAIIFINEFKYANYSRKFPRQNVKSNLQMKVQETSNIPEYKQYNWSEPVTANNLSCIDGHAHVKFKICPHVNRSDYASEYILHGDQQWEPFLSKAVAHYYNKYPKSTFIDVGVNIGTHSLYAAALGMHVVSVEPNPADLNNIHKAVLLNQFENKITLLPYAVADERNVKEMIFSVENIGVTHIVGGKRDELSVNKTGLPFKVKTMLLDDLLPFIKTETVLLKVDAEAYECHVIRNAKLFFTQLHIPIIFIETNGEKYAEPQCVKEMVNFLRDMDYTYVLNAQDGQPVDLPKYNDSAINFATRWWPWDTVWLPESLRFASNCPYCTK